MAKKNRNTLKNYFQKGRLPSSEHFDDLIDSALNIIDEGLDKSASQGLKIAQLGESGKLISFFKDIAVKSPLWSIHLDSSSGNLTFDSDEKENILTLTSQGRVGINKKDPDYELDVTGIIAGEGRIGRSGDKEVPADGEWHDITEELDGCHAFEIMAGVGGRKGSGKYSLMHAFALNTFNGKGNITYHQAHFDSRCNRLKLRWVGDTHSYRLQLKTGC